MWKRKKQSGILCKDTWNNQSLVYMELGKDEEKRDFGKNLGKKEAYISQDIEKAKKIRTIK